MPSAGAYALLCCRIENVVRAKCCCPQQAAPEGAPDVLRRGRCCSDGAHAAPRAEMATAKPDDLARPIPAVAAYAAAAHTAFREIMPAPARPMRRAAGPPLLLLKHSLLI